MIKDSGNRTEFKSGAVRDIQEGKGRCDLLPLVEVGEWLDPEHPLNIFTMVNEYRKSPSVNRMRVILDTFAAELSAADKDIADLEDLKKYRCELVLEVSKHFEEGAKKYGDRNWEKGIPCDRYIDSAIRHYLKWRAGWTDEPHDRAFMWNILCCEWTRQQYGWSLEKIQPSPEEEAYVNHDKAVTDSSAYDFSLASNRSLKKWENILGVKHSLLDVPWACDESKSESKKFLEIGEQFSEAIGDSMDAITKHLSESLLTIHIKKEEIKNEDILEQIKDQEFSDLKAACNVAERYNACRNTPVDVCCTRSCMDCEHNVETEDIAKALNRLADYFKRSLTKVCENTIDNRYVEDTEDGWKFYDQDGQLIGYIFKFKEPEEAKKRQVGTMIRKVWHEITNNPFIIKRLVEERGYVCNKDFSICIAPSIIAKEYNFRNRKYNEED